MNKSHLLYNINMEPNTLHTLLANLQDMHCDNWSCKGLVVGLFLYKVSYRLMYIHVEYTCR